MDVDLRKIAQAVRISLPQVEAVVSLLDAQATVPFITRYRKDQTGGLDEEKIRRIQSELLEARALSERKQTIIRSIESQGKLTPELREKIEAAPTSKVLEDLYLPYKPKKQTLASVARGKGLEPLALEILNADPLAADLDRRAEDFVDQDKKIVPTGAEAILGAGHIIAELFSEKAELRGKLRSIVRKTGRLVASVADGVDQEKAKEFRDYFNFSEPLDKLPPHRILAINRGERSKMLKVLLDADANQLVETTLQECVPEGHVHKDILTGCAQDALDRLILPSLEREFRRDLTDRAEEHAVQVFAKNLRNLLLQPPVRNKRVLAVDPGFRTGCKLVALDEYGNILEHAVVYLVGKDEKKAEAPAKLEELVRKHNVNVIAIGNGTGCREAEDLVAGLIAGPLAGSDVAYVIVNEAGASIYSTSEAGREEFPDLDATGRGTVSIGRRLQDPLSELVKIEPQHLGVGMYQHDVKQKHLQQSLDDVVESAVNYVGVDVNTASPHLLRYVAGLNQLVARRIVEHRKEHGPFKNREQFKDVSGFGPATFTNAAGFLKIPASEQPLDSTWIHPESYDVAGKLLEKVGGSLETLKDRAALDALSGSLKALDAAATAAELGVGEFTIRDVIADLVRPGRDPREDLPPPIFKRGVLKIEDLEAGMELTGTVLNVVDFGAFVDVGLKDSGLVHISELANEYIRSPHDVVAVGDVVKVWVIAVDKERGRVSLSMLAPGTKQQGGPRGGQRGGRPEGAQGEGGARPPRGGNRPPRAGGQGGQGDRPQGQRREGGPRGGQRPGGPRGGRDGAPPKPATPTNVEGEAAQAIAKAGQARPPRVPGPPRGAERGPGGKKPFNKERRGGPGGPGGFGGDRRDRRDGNAPAEGAPTPETPAVPTAGQKKSGKPLVGGTGAKRKVAANEPLRSFGDLLNLMQKPEDKPAPPPPAAPEAQDETTTSE